MKIVATYVTLTGMDNNYQAKQQAEKLAYENQAKTIKGGVLSELARPSIRERVEASRVNAAAAASRRDRMEELACLLDKHPEIARILDLSEDIIGY